MDDRTCPKCLTVSIFNGKCSWCDYEVKDEEGEE